MGHSLSLASCVRNRIPLVRRSRRGKATSALWMNWVLRGGFFFYKSLDKLRRLLVLDKRSVGAQGTLPGCPALAQLLLRCDCSSELREGAMRFPFSLSHCFIRPFSSFQPPGFHFLPNFCFSLLWFFCVCMLLTIATIWKTSYCGFLKNNKAF